MKICLIASEIVPFAKTGGLADVVGAMGKYLSNRGHDARLIMPLYSSVDIRKFNIKPLKAARRCKISFGKQKYIYDFYYADLPQSKAQTYFIHCPALYNRSSIYTNEPDEHIRFALLSKAALELCRRTNWPPDIIHCNDWQTALTPVLLKTQYRRETLFQDTKTLLTIHNIGYQGSFKAEIINDLELSKHYKLFDGADLYGGKLNFLRSGLLHADKISTVSETYAREIQTVEYGEGLQELLQKRAADLTGILNGVDYDAWNPETDKHIPYHYSVKSLSDKKKNKEYLLRQASLKYDSKKPTIGMITRLAAQKGLELLDGVIEKIIVQYDIKLIVLGSGDEQYERYLKALQLQYPKNVVFYQGYNEPLSHLIEAGADIFLMPSRYEPCGMNQIFSLKYGAVPVVRKTGGLADTVEHYNWETQRGDGFVFEHFNKDGFYWALDYAVTTFLHRQAWKKIMKNGMRKDFSWDRQIQRYIDLYEQMTKGKR